MRYNRYCTMLLAFLFWGTGVLGGEAIWIEAENSAGGRRPKVEDASASGGGAVRSTHPWQPMVNCPAPPADGLYDLWIRYKGGPIQLKLRTGEGTVEKPWIWKAPADWQWSRLGRFSRTEMAKGLQVIRNNNAKIEVFVDCLVLVPVAEGDEPVEPEVRKNEPGEADAPVVLELRPDWSRRMGKAPVMGLNAFKGFNAEVIANPLYVRHMEYMDPPFLRLHNMGMLRAGADTWLNHEAGTWDSQRIAAALVAWKKARLSAELMINIPHAPPWMLSPERGKRIPPEKHAEFAAFCAELVRLVNVENKAGIKYWEVTNELDNTYWGKARKEGQEADPAELAHLVKMAAAAMRKVDPDIVIGGPAATRPDQLDELSAFAAATGDTLDFFSYHAYASGSATDADDHIFRRARTIGENGGMLRKALLAHAGRDWPLHLNEYNISWTWTTRDPRMGTGTGAAFDALVYIHAARAGVNTMNAWNEMDGVYGKMDKDFRLRPAAHLFALVNHFAKRAETSALARDADETCPALALVAGESTRERRMLLAAYIAPMPARILCPGFDADRAVAVYTITDTGLSRRTLSGKKLSGTGIPVVPHSVLFFLAVDADDPDYFVPFLATAE